MVGVTGFEPAASCSRSRIREVAEHLKVCDHCRLMMADYLSMSADDGGCGDTCGDTLGQVLRLRVSR